MFNFEEDFNSLVSLLESENVASSTIVAAKKLYTDTLKQQKAMESKLEHFENIFNHVPCTISHITNDLHYIKVNSCLAELCNINASDFINKKVGFQSKHPYFANFSKDLFSSDLPSMTREIEATLDGVDKFFFVQGLKIENNKEALIIGVDITELNKLKQTVVFLDRLSSVGEMMAGILHEISNPLTLIKNHGKMLNKQLSLIDVDIQKLEKSSNIIIKTSDKIEKIIAGIKAFVRKSEDKVPELVSFDKILEDSILICESTLHKSDVKLTCLKDNWPIINVNETQIFQVFVNLVTNSIHAIEELDNRWINIDWEESENDFLFSITDSGNGIDPKVQEQMFTSFYTTKGVGKGTGLGLSLCQKIIEGHGGGISIDSNSKNTRFIIRIPK
jgi:signal transduction histidine kinase